MHSSLQCASARCRFAELEQVPVPIVRPRISFCQRTVLLNLRMRMTVYRDATLEAVLTMVYIAAGLESFRKCVGRELTWR